eukprot:SAG31_NODE_902_length_11133_cov_4.169386_7_plen_65_part_00
MPRARSARARRRLGALAQHLGRGGSTARLGLCSALSEVVRCLLFGSRFRTYSIFFFSFLFFFLA